MDFGAPRIDQHALAHFISRGDLDRHLRRMRALYHARRDALLDVLSPIRPTLAIEGVAAGLHLTAKLPAGYDARTVQAQASARGMAIGVMSEFALETRTGSSTLLLGYARASDATMRIGAQILQAVLDTCSRSAAKEDGP